MDVFIPLGTISSAKRPWPMVILTISVNARSNKRNELLSACRLITDQTRQGKGCLGCRLSQDIDNENVINLEETWEHRSSLDEYFRSDIFSALLGAVKLLGENHEIRINDGSQTEGLEVVKRARGIY
jgi:quinol monooxygenase YgiN